MSKAKMPYKKGDKVFVKTVVDDNEMVANQIATVRLVDDDGSIGLVFDRNVDGHDLEGHCKNGYGWFVQKNHIRPVTKADVSWPILTTADGDVLRITKLTKKGFEIGEVFVTWETMDTVQKLRKSATK
jgi:hypothetical protein